MSGCQLYVRPRDTAVNRRDENCRFYGIDVLVVMMIKIIIVINVCGVLTLCQALTGGSWFIRSALLVKQWNGTLTRFSYYLQGMQRVRLLSDIHLSCLPSLISNISLNNSIFS